MTPQELNASLQIMAETMEAIDNMTLLSTAMQNLPFPELTPETWAQIVECQETQLVLLGMFKQSLSIGAAITGNEALVDHMLAVVTPEL